MPMNTRALTKQLDELAEQANGVGILRSDPCSLMISLKGAETIVMVWVKDDQAHDHQMMAIASHIIEHKDDYGWLDVDTDSWDVKLTWDEELRTYMMIIECTGWSS